MKKYFWIIATLINVTLAFAGEWGESSSNKWQSSDTVYVDTHKVMYVVDSSSNNAGEESVRAEGLTEAEALKDTFGLSAPPYTKHRLYAEIVSQNLAPGITYEYLFADFWSFAVRFSYASFSKKNIAEYTDVEGEMYAYSFPLMMRWYYGRRNGAKTQVINAAGQNSEVGQKSQFEGFVQLRMDPIFYQVDLVDPEDKRNLFPHSESGFAFVVGTGCRLMGSRFFLGSEINFGRFVKKPQFMDGIHVSVSNKYIYTRLLEKIFFETALSVGFVF
jgi:hypothetical protein